jgi:membrane protein
MVPGESFFQRSRAKIKNIQEQILGIRFIKFIMRVMTEMSQDDGTNMAAGIAYYAFLSIFPLILGLIGLLGLFLPSQTVQTQIFSFIQQNLPGAGSVVEENVRNVIQLRGTLGIIGILGLLWTGSGIISAAGHAINRAWDINKELQFYLKKPRDLGLTIGLGTLFFLSLGSGAIFSFVPVGSIPFIGEYAVQFVLRILSFILAFIIFLILFKVIPNTKTWWRHIWVGAVFTALLFEIGRIAFLFYIDNFGNYQMVYGTIGSVIALLIWIYYSAIIVILGAELTAEYSRLRRGVSKGTHSHTSANP